MPKTKQNSKSQKTNSKVNKGATKVTIQREADSKKITSPLAVFAQKLQLDLKNRESVFSLILGALIVIVLGVLLFNFFNKPQTLSSTTTAAAQTQQNADVDKNNLPGKYTVKNGDTLFDIAQKYYGNGYEYDQIAQANNLSDANVITTGQVLEIPKPNPTPSATPTATDNSQQSYQINSQSQTLAAVTNDQTEWGEKITTDTYTVQSGDWLSKIAGRAYGDIYAYSKIAQANNISNPNEIEPGTVLRIPRG